LVELKLAQSESLVGRLSIISSEKYSAVAADLANFRTPRRYQCNADGAGTNRRRKEVASKSELEFRLAKLDWYLQRLEEWAKLTHDFCDGPIAGGSSVSSSEQASVLLPSYQLGELRAAAPISRRQGREGRPRRGR
jgi:hypothetical protein